MLANPFTAGAAMSTGSVNPLAAGVSQGLSDAMGNLAQDHSDMGGVIQGIKTDLDSVMRQAGVSPQGGLAPVPPGAGGQVADQFRSHVSRLAYVTVLHKAIKRTRHQKNFNIETAMNDLWNALNGIKKGDKTNQQIASSPGGAPNQLPAVQNQMAQNMVLMQQMSSMMQSMNESAGTIIKNMK
jgi:hypothetical protein